MCLYYEIHFIRKSDGASVHSDVCGEPRNGLPALLQEHMKELVEKADFSKPWGLVGHGVCEEHSEAPCKIQS